MAKKQPTNKQKERQYLDEIAFLRQANKKYLDALGTMSDLYNRCNQMEYAMGLEARALQRMGVTLEDVHKVRSQIQDEDRLTAEEAQQESKPNTSILGLDGKPVAE